MTSPGVLLLEVTQGALRPYHAALPCSKAPTGPEERRAGGLQAVHFAAAQSRALRTAADWRGAVHGGPDVPFRAWVLPLAGWGGASCLSLRVWLAFHLAQAQLLVLTEWPPSARCRGDLEEGGSVPRSASSLSESPFLPQGVGARSVGKSLKTRASVFWLMLPTGQLAQALNAGHLPGEQACLESGGGLPSTRPLGRRTWLRRQS